MAMNIPDPQDHYRVLALENLLSKHAVDIGAKDGYIAQLLDIITEREELIQQQQTLISDQSQALSELGAEVDRLSKQQQPENPEEPSQA